MSHQDSLAIGATIKKLRNLRGLTQAQLSTAIGVTSGTMSLIEAGRRSTPLDTLNRISTALGFPLTLVVFLAVDTDNLSAYDEAIAGKLQQLAWRLISDTLSEVN